MWEAAGRRGAALKLRAGQVPRDGRGWRSRVLGAGVRSPAWAQGGKPAFGRGGLAARPSPAAPLGLGAWMGVLGPIPVNRGRVLSSFSL